jgi:hypothetical protein
MLPRSSDAGLPAEPYFRDVLFNRATGAVVVYCSDRSLERPDRRVYHRLHDSDTYVLTFALRPMEMVASVVVALDAPVVAGVVCDLVQHGETWGMRQHRVVVVHLNVDGASRETRHDSPSDVEYDNKRASFSHVGDVISIGDDGQTIFVTAAVGDEPGPPKPIRYGIFRWDLRSDDVKLVAKLPGVFW